MFVLPAWLRYAFALAYLYGAAVHCMNMLDLTGFDWSGAPARWQLLDVVYLSLDVAVVGFLVKGRATGTGLLAAAAASQIVLYTLLREWVLDVPAAYSVDPAAEGYLDFLIVFHVVTLASILAAVLWRAGLRPGNQQMTSKPRGPVVRSLAICFLGLVLAAAAYADVGHPTL